MRAAYLGENGLCVRDHHEPRPGPGEIPVRVKLAGICETDLQLIRGYMGFEGVLGHEFVGVAAAGKYEGRRVVGEINCACGLCESCHAGLANHCPSRSVIGILDHDGAFAELVFVPEENLHPVPDSVPDEVAVFVEPLAAAFRIADQVDLDRFSSAVVVGDGRLGYLVSQVLANHCQVTVVGKHESKLQRFANLGLATQRLNVDQSRREFDLAVDCTGSESGIPTALKYLRPTGTLILKTTHAGDVGPNLAPLVIDEISVVGSRCGPFGVALQALVDGQIEVRSLISSRFGLAEAVAAFEQAAIKGESKVLIEVE